jgi:hypothetical protein
LAQIKATKSTLIKDSSKSIVVNPLTHNPKIEGFDSSFSWALRKRKIAVTNSTLNKASSKSTVVNQLTHNPNFEGLIPAAIGIGKKKNSGSKINFKQG